MDPLRQDWDDLGELDPYWAVLSNPKRRFGRWDKEEFLATGERIVEAIMQEAQELRVPKVKESALDFGCGLGRLSRPFATRFERVVGVDISEEMLLRATSLNRDVANLEFVLNTRSDLRTFRDDSFDVVCSEIVLQHVPSRADICAYLKEFVRVLKRDGLLVFQLPHSLSTVRTVYHRLMPRKRLYALLRAVGFSKRFLYERLNLHPMTVTAIAEPEVLEVLRTAGAKVLKVRREAGAAYSEDRFYYVSKEPRYTDG
jgi:ubiquinone/menaquinone biosynthesis C-methylase UbiE